MARYTQSGTNPRFLAPGVRIVVARPLVSEPLSGHHLRGSRWTVYAAAIQYGV